MSDATRFSVRAVTFDDGTASVIHSSDVDGEYVLHTDYARLKAECQARQAENSVLAVECDSLKAEVERLKEGNEYLDQMHEKEMARSAFLCEQVERLTKAVASSPVAQAKLKELEGKTTFDEINPKEGKPRA